MSHVDTRERSISGRGTANAKALGLGSPESTQNSQEASVGGREGRRERERVGVHRQRA